MSNYPQMFRVRQHRERPVVEDIPGEVENRLAALGLQSRVRPGESVAISAGSRGIANIHIIVRAIVRHFEKMGAKPFLVPAMGSHGGGTAEGQRKIIESYGMTEEFVGCPIRASMETVQVCQTAEGIPVHFDRLAHAADHVVVCARVKPHTNFVGEIESGLMKMMLIGLGKHEGAKIYHRAILDYSFDQIVHSVADEVLARCKIVAGVAIVENAYDETAHIEAVEPREFVEREKQLLLQAKEWMPRLPFRFVDILIVDEIGKNISGSGLDTNVVGRKFHTHQAAEHEFPKVKQIVVRGLTRETHGNAAGIGFAEFCTTRLVEQMDVHATRVNCLTGGGAAGAMMPLSYDSDRELLDVALPGIGLTEPPQAGILWIRNTLQVAELECAASYWDEAQQREDLEIISELRDFAFDEAGNFVAFQPALLAPHATG